MIGPELYGRRVRLRPLRDGDLDRRVEWLQDVETQVLFTGRPLAKQYASPEAYQWRINLETDPSAVVFAIDDRTGRHIGYVDLHRIDWREKSARLTILIGERSARGAGYGTDAIETLLYYAFRELGLEEVRLRVFNFNKRAIRCYEKCGFVVTGGWDGMTPDSTEVFMAISRERMLALHPDVETLRAA